MNAKQELAIRIRQLLDDNVLHSFFRWMQVEEFLTHDPTARIKSFKIDNKEARRPLTHEQLELVQMPARLIAKRH